MKTENIHIGNHIQQRLQHDGRTIKWFSEQLKCDRRNVYNIFRKSSLNTEQLYRICEILHYDFFVLYSQQLTNKGLID